MKYLLLFPLIAFGQISITPISHFPTTGLKTQLQLISQDTPNTPVVYKKFTAGSLRSWIDSSAMDSAGCQSKINCDSTGTGDMVRQATPTIASPTITGVLSNTGRDTTAGRIASHGSIKSDSNLTSASMNLSSGGANNGYVCYTASTHAFTVSDTSCPHP